MKKIVKVSAMLLLLNGTLNASTDGLYIGVGGGFEFATEYVSNLDRSIDQSKDNALYGGLVKVGYGVLENLAIELRHSQAFAGGDSLAHRNLISGYLKPKMDIVENINLYGLAGFGLNNATFNKEDKTRHGYANQDQSDPSIGGGIEYAYNNLGVFVEVLKVINTNDDSDIRDTQGDIDTLGVFAGVSYYFNKKEIIEEPIEEVVEPLVLNKPQDIEVLFESGKSVVAEQYHEALNRYVTFLNTKTTASLDIVGYTDSQGSNNYNQKLSEKRAEAIKSYLVEQGVDASRINAVGKGEESPRASNETQEGRASNRRIEAQINDL